MGNILFTPNSSTNNIPAFLFERIISNEIKIGVLNDQRQGLKFNNIIYYYKNLIEQKNKLIYQFENTETDQVFFIIEKYDDNISYILEIDNKKHIGNINETIRKFSKNIDFQSNDIDKIFLFIK
jgi:hypothetical protein